MTSKKLVIQGNIKDYKGNNVVGTNKLSVKINGKTLKDTNNNTRLFNISNGIINFNFNLPGKLKSGNHILSIVIPELRETLSLRMNYTMTII